MKLNYVPHTTKAVLLIDMPRDCLHCQLVRADFMDCGGKKIQGDFNEYYEIKKYYNTRPSWCPLKEMPLEKDVDYSKVCDYQDGYYAEGWNACLEELVK